MAFVLLIFWMSLGISQSAMDLMSSLIVLWTAFHFSKINKTTNFSWRIGLEKIWPVWLGAFFLGIVFLVPKSHWDFNRVSEMKWILVLYSLVLFYSFHGPWENTKVYRWFCYFLIFASAHAAVASFIDYDFILQKKLSDASRAGGFFDDPMGFAHVYGAFFVFSFAWLLNEINLGIESKINWIDLVKKYSFELTAFLVTGFAVLLSLTRGIWMAAAVACLVSSFLVKRKWGWLSLLSAVGVTGALLISWPMFRERLFFVFNSSQNYDGERIWLWKSNWQMFLDHPWLGVGYGEYREWLPIYFEKLGAPPHQQLISHSHNQYLHLLANTGIFGGLCYVAFLLMMVTQSYRLYKKYKNSSFSSWIIGSIAAQVCFILGGLTECNFERAKMRLTYLALASLPFAADQYLKMKKYPPQKKGNIS